MFFSVYSTYYLVPLTFELDTAVAGLKSQESPKTGDIPVDQTNEETYTTRSFRWVMIQGPKSQYTGTKLVSYRYTKRDYGEML